LRYVRFTRNIFFFTREFTNHARAAGKSIQRRIAPSRRNKRGKLLIYVFIGLRKKTHVLSGWRCGKFANGNNELRVACSVTLFEGEGLDEGEFLAGAFLGKFPIVQKLLRSGMPAFRSRANGARRCAHLRPRVAASQRDALVRCATANVPSSGFPEDSANLIEMIAVMSGHMLCESSH